MEIREIEQDELGQLLLLYTHLHNNEVPHINAELHALWAEILVDRNHHILGAFSGGKLVSSCVLLIVPNLTQNRRPYALVENVVTDLRHRNKGYASLLLRFAIERAKAENCYKVMLMTGSKMEETLRFYEAAGFNRADKTAFVQWL